MPSSENNAASKTTDPNWLKTKQQQQQKGI